MSVSEQVSRLKDKADKDQLLDDFNGVTSTLLKKAMANIANGQMTINDPTDLEKIYRIYKDVNDLQDGVQGGNGDGALPELNAGQEHIIEQRVKVHVDTDTDSQGNIVQKKTIKLSDLANLNADDTKDLIDAHEKKLNADNAKDIL